MKHMFGYDMMVSGTVSDRKSSITKADIWLGAAIVVTVLLILLIFRLNRTQGSYANVTCDGRVLIQIPLTQTETKYYLLTECIILTDGEVQADTGQLQEYAKYSQPAGQSYPAYDIRELSENEWKNAQLPPAPAGDYNVIVYQDGKVRMAESSCPDQICVRHSAIYAAGESIICLPHKIVVEVIGDKERGLDGVVY